VSQSAPVKSLSVVAAAEFAGTALLLAAVAGSGTMGQTLADGNEAVALLANALATAGALYVLILVLAPFSGAEFNPLVTLLGLGRPGFQLGPACLRIAAQCAGAVAGIWLCHAMFGEAVFQLGGKLREGPAQLLSEAVASFGLLMTIGLLAPGRADRIPGAVAAYIGAAYWFTASTAFANPAATLARMLTAGFVSISPSSVPWFLAGQGTGFLLAFLLLRRLWRA